MTTITYGSAAAIILISVLLIYNTVGVGIAAQHEKIRVMFLMGARDGFIRIPYIVEGLVMGILGMVLPLALLYLVYRWGIHFAVTQLHVFGGGIRLLPRFFQRWRMPVRQWDFSRGVSEARWPWDG